MNELRIEDALGLQPNMNISEEEFMIEVHEENPHRTVPGFMQIPVSKSPTVENMNFTIINFPQIELSSACTPEDKVKNTASLVSDPLVQYLNNITMNPDYTNESLNALLNADKDGQISAHISQLLDYNNNNNNN